MLLEDYRFMGKPYEYWQELDIQAKELNIEDTVMQNAVLRAENDMLKAKIRRLIIRELKVDITEL